MPRESYFLIKWEMIFRTSALLNSIPCGFARWWWRLSFWPTKWPRWSLESVKSQAAPSENLLLSVSRAEITVQFRSAFRICQQHTEREEARGEKKKRKGEGSYRQHGISLSFSMENVAQWSWGLGLLSAARDERSANLIGLLQEVWGRDISQGLAEVRR